MPISGMVELSKENEVLSSMPYFDEASIKSILKISKNP